MRKPYTKPTIVYEDFSLSTTVASCEHAANHADRNNCGYQLYWGATVFASVGVCNYTAAVDYAADGTPIYMNQICYHVPIESNNLFSS